MALDYTGASTGLFTHLGKLVKHYNQFKTDATHASTGLDADRKEIYDAFEDGDLELVLDGLAAAFERWKVEYVERRRTLAAYALARLQDRDTVLDEIGATSSDAAEILAKLIDQMVADSETVAESTVTLGSVTAGGGNTGNGTVLTTKVLDGYSSPGSREGVVYPAHAAYNGWDTELCVPDETMVLQCVEDSYQVDGVVSFSWQGKMPDVNGQYGIGEEGSGSVGTVNEVHVATDALLSNADFETFTVADTPDDWTIESGTAGTHIKENSTAANVAHGDKSLQFVGDGSQSEIKISQDVSSDVVDTNRRYVVTVQIKADASIAAGTLTIQFEGTGYTPGSGEKIEIAPGSLPTSFEIKHFFVTMPQSIPDDFKLAVKWAGTPTSGKNLYVDDIGIAPVSYGGGAGVAVVRGTTAFVRTDKFTFTVSNSEGVFQRAFRQFFGVQLPSAGSPTIADSLAT
jgi:hypothetical protein